MSEPEEELQEEQRDNTKKKKKKKEQRSGKKKKKEKQEHEEQVEVEVEEQSECVVLRGIFKLGKKSHDVLLTRTRLTWTPIIPETPTGDVSMLQPGVVLLQDVFAVKVKRRRAASQQSGGPVLGVAVFYGRRKGRRLEEDTLHLHNASAEHTNTWYNTLKELLTGFSSRPRYVKVFINPSSHKKEAVHIYREHVAPLFKMADVRTDITVTERKGHALSVMKECKLDEYDGVVCVGGDGSVAELCHALVLRAQLDADSPVKPVKAVLPLGIIPAGSTDVVSCSVHGVRDPVTAALHIVLAPPPSPLPTSSQCVNVLMSCLKTKSDPLFLRDQDPDLDPEPEGEESWTTNQGLYLSISIMSIPCLSPHAPQGLAPNTSVANGSAALIAVGNTSRSEFIKHLKRYSSSSGQFSFSFVETHSVSAVRIRPRLPTGWSEEESEEEGDPRTTPIIQAEGTAFPWNIDGELVEIANEVVIRVHPRLITLYGEEVDEAESTVSCSCI
ncbi:ceramide kinase-like protein [Stegastes partitus]|uniref:Ceramide kinase-like protein n=2 Tax=Stegastes partitus TaxID=144197 RepID=A0A9Y4MTJ4_9TELE|nr:PREDICTED: ceramide kinase-like protein [Stegastes partitus]